MKNGMGQKAGGESLKQGGGSETFPQGAQSNVSGTGLGISDRKRERERPRGM